MPKILVVDDEPDILDLFAEGLARYVPDAQVVTAGSGEHAQRLVQHDGFAAVITDERMAGMTGSQLLSWLRESHPKMRRVLMTAFGGPAFDETAKAAGAELVLAKPFGMAQAARHVLHLLESRRAS